jgi:hypothetical protein
MAGALRNGGLRGNLDDDFLQGVHVADLIDKGHKDLKTLQSERKQLRKYHRLEHVEELPEAFNHPGFLLGNNVDQLPVRFLRNKRTVFNGSDFFLLR